MKMKKDRKNFVSLKKTNSKSDNDEYDSEDSNVDLSKWSHSAGKNDVSDDMSASDSGTEKSKTNGKRKNVETESEHPPKKKKVGKHLYKPPTVEEINQLRETENLFHSNLFRMQIKEMMKEIKVKRKHKTLIQGWVDNFNEFLSGLKSMPEREEGDKLKFLKKTNVKLPLILERIHKKKFQFQFLKPTEKAFIVGSAKGNTQSGSSLTVDVCVLMPLKSFQKENYLNLIYDQKRALYLMYIAHKMIKAKFECEALQFNFYKSNVLKPVLEVKPAGSKIIFRIFACPERNSFKLNRFVPWNSNIRSDLFEGETKEDELYYATPAYNANALFDLTLKCNQEFINDYLLPNTSLQEGLILLKIWLKQCNLDLCYTGFGSHIMTMFVVYLFKAKKLNAAMSSYQVARNVWNHLAASNWNEEGKGITLCDSTTHPNQPTLEQFHAHYDVVFIDSTGFLNLCANLSLDFYIQVKLESQRAIELLDNKKVNSFQLLFLTKTPAYLKFDHILKICNEEAVHRTLRKYGSKHDTHNFAGYWYPHAMKLISDLIRKGLGKRIKYLSPVETSDTCWDVTSPPNKPKNVLKIGLVLDPENAFEILDKGPQANEAGAEEFRKFWGDKSQLRRFQDGSITEACVWCPPNALLTEKRVIVKKIISHLLHHHFDFTDDEVLYVADEFDLAYKLNKNITSELGDAENAALKVIKCFDDVGKRVRSVQNVPLEVTSVQGISSVFRYANPKPVLDESKFSKNLGQFFSHDLNEGIIQMGISGKWPKELPAFRRIKTAFHIQIARGLRSQFKMQAKGDIDGVYVMHDGYVFRLEIAHQKEIAALKKEVTSDGVLRYKDTTESEALEKRYVVLPKLTSGLHALHQRNPSFGPAVMIAKRWLCSQLIDNFLWPEECTELLVASQFLKIGGSNNPHQPQVGFFRFLHLLANSEWQNELVIVNFNDEMNDEEITQLENEFSSDREKYPPLCIKTSYDASKTSIWSKSAPTKHVLARVKVLAKHTINVIESNLLSDKPTIVKELFIPRLQGYDVIINLRPNFTFYPGYNISLSKAISSAHNKLPPAGFNAIEKCLKELREAYSDYAVFFYNPYGGSQIAVLFHPEVRQAKDFKVTAVNGCHTTAKGKIMCNINAFIEDFKVIANGLYLSIETEKKV